MRGEEDTAMQMREHSPSDFPALDLIHILISTLISTVRYLCKGDCELTLIPCSADLVLYTGLKSTRGRGPKAAVILDGAAC